MKQQGRAHICHEYHELYSWREKCPVEKFQLSIQNLNNLWSFIEVYAVFVPNLCEEKSEKITNMRSAAGQYLDEHKKPLPLRKFQSDFHCC